MTEMGTELKETERQKTHLSTSVIPFTQVIEGTTIGKQIFLSQQILSYRFKVGKQTRLNNKASALKRPPDNELEIN